MKYLWLILFALPAKAELPEVATQVEAINALRESLVSSIQGDVSAQTFKAVCKPIGMRAKTESKKRGWKFRQVSDKYRNPEHKPNAFEKAALREFLQNPKLTSYSEHHEDGLRYYRRITVRTTCLKCHGEMQKRPEFIIKKYKQDKAFGFKVGDLRGIYSVFVPKK